MYKLEYDLAPSSAALEEFSNDIDYGLRHLAEKLAIAISKTGNGTSVSWQVGAWGGIIEYSFHVVCYINNADDEHAILKVVLEFKALWQQQAVGFRISPCVYSFI
jgi:hypothetical protein